MKKITCLLMVLMLLFTTLIGCATKDTSVAQKTEEELKAEVREEMEQEARAKLEAEKKEEELKEQEEKKEQEKREQEKKDEKEQEEQKKEEEKQSSNNKSSSSDDVLIYSNNKNYYKYKTNKVVKFDIDEDGTKEEIIYDTNKGKLIVTGYDPIDTYVDHGPDYFIIIKFSDQYNTKMNMIGIIDYGPSDDYTTSLFSIIAPQGENWFGSVGRVEGEVVPPSEYDEDNGGDFAFKAVIRDGVGIEAPVRLNIMSHLQTWWGRNDFTYYSTYCRLLDNSEKYEQDYETRLELNLEKDVTVYSEKDLNSKSSRIKGGQKVYFIATDNNEWIGIVSEDENMGWINIKDINNDNFSGFQAFD